MIIEVSSREQLANIIKTYTYVIIDFYADWCNPCKKLSAYITNKTDTKTDPDNKYYTQIIVCKIKIDDEEFENIEKLTEEYHVSGLPCLVFYKSAVQFDKLEGFSETKTNDIIKKMFN